MNKKCKVCGALVPNDVKFCQICGNAEFVVNNSATNGITFTQNNQQDSFSQGWQLSVSHNQPKKMKTGLIIGIIAAILIVLATTGMIVAISLQERGNRNNDSYSKNEKIYYSVGNFDGTIYTNKWADIELSLPEGFSNADLATYATAENSNTECGVYFIADDTMSLIYICYEKLPTFPVYDEEEYLYAATKSLQNISGVVYQIPDEYESISVAGNSYVKAVCPFNNGNGDFVQTIYVRKLDNYMIFISAIGINADSNDALVDNITEAQ